MSLVLMVVALLEYSSCLQRISNKFDIIFRNFAISDCLWRVTVAYFALYMQPSALDMTVNLSLDNQAGHASLRASNISIM